VGPDLARCVARIESRRQPGTNTDDAAVENDGERTDDPEEAGDVLAVGGKALPLSA
jgi:single-strand DNA-binding protein